MIRRTPTFSWCPFDHQAVDFSFTATGPSAKLTLQMPAIFDDLGVPTQNNTRLDNIAVVERKIFNANLLTNTGNCYNVTPFASYFDFPGVSSGIAFLEQFSQVPSPNWLDVDRAARALDGTNAILPAFWTVLDNAQDPASTTQGALGLGRATDTGLVSTSVAIGNLVPGRDYMVTGSWFTAGTAAIADEKTLQLDVEQPGGICLANQVPVDIFKDDLENGVANWSTAGGVQNTWGLSQMRAFSGASSFHAADVSTLSDQILTSTTIALPSTTPLALHFMNYQSIENNGANRCFDGAVAEISSDGGSTWTRIENELVTDPYDGAVHTGLGNTIAGQNAWCADPQGWVESITRLDAFAGQTVQVRFRLLTDSSVGREGWYLDDVRITRCAYLFNHDFDADFRADILWRHRVSGANALWLMNGRSASKGQITIVGSTAQKIQGMGDFDGDGNADIFWRNTATGTNAIWLMNGRTASFGATQTVTNLNFNVAGVGDFDGDGKSDVLWRDPTIGQNTIWLMNGRVNQNGPINPAPVGWKVAGVCDFDADGKDDILWRNGVDGRNSIWLMNARTASFGGISTVQDLSIKVSGVGDFDGNGTCDILWRNTVNGANPLWLMNGRTASFGTTSTVANLDLSVVQVSDFDGDGKADILWRNRTTGSNSMWLMNGRTASFGATSSVTDLNWEVVP